MAAGRIPKPLHTTGIGRNEDPFRHCVRLAHQPRWARIIAAEGHAGRWLEHVCRLNFAEFAENPLADSECQSIAKSCAKYSLRNYSAERFSGIQTARITRRWHLGRKDYSYQDRAQTVGLMTELGYSQADLAICRGREKSKMSQGVSDGHSMTGLMPRSGNK